MQQEPIFPTSSHWKLQIGRRRRRLEKLCPTLGLICISLILGSRMFAVANDYHRRRRRGDNRMMIESQSISQVTGPLYSTIPLHRRHRRSRIIASQMLQMMH